MLSGLVVNASEQGIRAEDGAGGVANVDMGGCCGHSWSYYWEEKPAAVIHTGFQQQDYPNLPHCGFYCAGAYLVPYGRPQRSILVCLCRWYNERPGVLPACPGVYYADVGCTKSTPIVIDI